MTCLICMNDAFHGLPMQDKDELALRARDFIQGLILTAAQSNKESFKAFKPRRRGIGLVERCARDVETSCRGCQESGCQRCVIATELRAAEDRLEGEREAELAELGFDDQDLEEMIDKVVGGLCKAHAPFGSALALQWYSSRLSFSSLPTSHDA